MPNELVPLIEAITKLTQQVAEGQKELVKEVRSMSEAFKLGGAKFDPAKLVASTKDANAAGMKVINGPELQDPLKSFPQEIAKLAMLNAQSGGLVR